MLCQAWYDQQPSPSEWQNEVSCPTTYNQGIYDFSFQAPLYTVRQGRSALTGVVNNTVLEEFSDWTDGTICLQESFPASADSGATCCYDPLYYAFVNEANSGGGGHYARDMIVFRSGQSAIDYLVNDVTPGIQCCQESTNPGWCKMYNEKRPPTETQGHVVYQSCGAYGDPHLTTLTGVRFTYSGLGEYTLLQTLNGELMVQMRMTQNRNINGSFVNASIITSVALRHRGSENITYQLEVANGTTQDVFNLTIIINGLRINSDQIKSLENQERLSFPQATMQSDGTYLRIDFEVESSRIFFLFRTVGASLTVITGIPLDDFYERINGLYGLLSRNTSEVFQLRNGTVLNLESLKFQPIASPTTVAEQRWNEYIPEGWIVPERVAEFGESWRISENNSIFTYPAGMNWSSYNDLNFEPEYLQTLLAEASEEALNIAVAACTDSAGEVSTTCLQDVLITSDVSRGQPNFEIVSPLDNVPPTFTPSLVTFNVVLNEVFTHQLNVSDQDGDPFSLKLLGEIATNSNASLNSTGFFTWTPTSTNVTNLRILATDSFNLSSLLIVEIVMCACQNNGTCLSENFAVSDNSNRFYVQACDCTKAWDGTYCSNDRNDCTSLEPCFNGVNCTDEIAPSFGYKCGPCPVNFTGDGTLCVTDYCASNTCSQNQDCVNIPNFGRPLCICKSGFLPDPFNITTCVDDNECETGLATCDSTTTTCRNTMGSYVCDCNPGLTNNTAGVCDDIYECESNTNSCDNSSTICVNQFASYRCECRPGFKASNNTLSCDDIDECSTGEHTCLSTEVICVNTIGGFRCNCSAGYEPGVEANTCVDIDECKTLGRCPESPIGSCRNFDSSYVCDCITGYVYNNVTNTCDDVNECFVNDGRGECSTTCTNTNGSFVCSCNSGFKLDSDGLSCSDIDECTTTVPCSQNCINSEGSFICSCFDGFYLNGSVCEANVTCSVAQSNACVNADCFMNGTEPVCVCQSGYSRVNATTCVDIDECSGANQCHEDANCTNTVGSYSCSCKPHYIDISGVGNPRGLDCKILVAPVVANIEDSSIGLNTVSVRWGLRTEESYYTVYLMKEGSTTPIQETNVSINVQTFTFDQLETNTTYSFNIVIVQNGVSSEVSSRSFTTKPDLVPPTFNVINDGTDITSNSIMISWTAPPSGIPVDGYQLQYSTPGVATSTLTFNTSTTTTLLSNLKPTSLYNISIATTYGFNISVYKVIQQYTAPEPPTNVTVVLGEIYGQVTLSWSSPLEGQADTYEVSVTPDGTIFTRNSSAATSGLISNMSPGVTYTISIVTNFMSLSSAQFDVAALVPITTPAPTTTPEASTAPEASTTPEVSTTPESSTTPEASTAPESSTTPESSSTTMETITGSSTSATSFPTLSCPPYYSQVGGACIESQYFNVELSFSDTFDTQLNIPSSDVAIDFTNRYTEVLTIISESVSITIIEIGELTFTSGSTIVTSQTKLANVTNIASTQAAINSVVNSGSLSSFNLNKATILNIDECSNTTYIDCDSEAICSDADAHPGFTCACKPGYRDLNVSNPGRSCEYQCSLNGGLFCLNGGTCTPVLVSDVPFCACTNWYQGARCESLNAAIVAAIVVGIIAGILLIITIVAVVCVCRSKRRSGINLQYSDRSKTASRVSIERYRVSEADEESNVGSFNFSDFRT